MASPVVYGADYSTYVRTVRLALLEKGVPYTLVPVDVFGAEGRSPEHLARHPFGKIPAFEHDGLRLHETGAIVRYVDEAFAGPALQPTDARARARMNQIIGVVDAYAYDTLVWKVYVERNAPRLRERPADEAAIAAALPRVATCMGVLEGLAADARCLCGDAPGLADCFLVPVFAYFATTPEGARAIAASNRLGRWWRDIATRDSVRATIPAN